MNIFSKIKYPILKLIDLSGLTFLAPVVRLCYNEEPQVQLKKIGQWIIVPCVAIVFFLIAWHVIAGNIKTKSGTLPTPSETISSFEDINTIHKREKLKEEAYLLEGEEREERVEEVKAQIIAAEATVNDVNEKMAKQEELKAEKVAQIVASIDKKYKEFVTNSRAQAKLRKAELADLSSSITPGDTQAYDELIAKVRVDRKQKKQDTETRNELKMKRAELLNRSFPKYTRALRDQTRVVETIAFLKSYLTQLTDRNKSTAIGLSKERITELKKDYPLATGPDALKAATAIVIAESQIENKETSEYAGAKTIWYQVERSVLCVFAGFLLGAAIAIPLGILCGLNNTFMAVMTPFIAIFKPVSPIVWLPIVLIVVMGAFPNPDTHPFMTFLAELPLIGQYKINPAFMASAVTVSLCSLWATMANTALGVSTIDKDHLNVAKVLKLGFFSRLFKIVIPSALPLIFGGLRISLGVGWMVLIAAELISSSEGIGKFVNDQFSNGSSDSLAKMIVVVFIVGFIGLILDRIMVVLQRLVTFEGAGSSL